MVPEGWFLYTLVQEGLLPAHTVSAGDPRFMSCAACVVRAGAGSRGGRVRAALVRGVPGVPGLPWRSQQVRFATRIYA